MITVTKYYYIRHNIKETFHLSNTLKSKVLSLSLMLGGFMATSCSFLASTWKLLSLANFWAGLVFIPKLSSAILSWGQTSVLLLICNWMLIALTSHYQIMKRACHTKLWNNHHLICKKETSGEYFAKGMPTALSCSFWTMSWPILLTVFTLWLAYIYSQSLQKACLSREEHCFSPSLKYVSK